MKELLGTSSPALPRARCHVGQTLKVEVLPAAASCVFPGLGARHGAGPVAACEGSGGCTCNSEKSSLARPCTKSKL